MNLDELCINTIRMLSADAVQKANSGHPGMPMGDAAMAYVLWTRFLKHNPKNPFWQNRDRFVLSAGHGSMLLYSLLHLTGHRISLKDIKNFRQWESTTPGHPEYCLRCGIETTTGPLGQGFGTGVGMAIGQRYLADMFNRPGHKIVDYFIYAITSDGDMMEGISSEAASLAGHLGLGKLIYLYSDNKISIDGPTNLSFTENVGARFRAYKWHVQKVDGNDLKQVETAIRRAQKEIKRPSLIIARTHIGYGSPNKHDTADAHGAPLGQEELKLTKEQFGWPQKKFHIPKKALLHFRTAVAAGNKTENAWQNMFKKYKKHYPSLAKQWNMMKKGDQARSVRKYLPVFKPADGPLATRSASGKVLNNIADHVPQLIGGSADLTPSNNTYLKNYPNFNKKKGGRNLHFGVREHGMGAALNGMALSNMLIPYGGTFLIFSDYMRPAIRIAALLETQVIYVFTHDSVGLGEDGPTHQPIGHLTSLRAMPGLTVIRPADANETAVAWEIALGHTNGPVALILTRQKLPVIDRKKYASASGVKKGGYILADSGKKPELVLIASGSEVPLALAAFEQLAVEGKKVRLVNLASFELFDKQSTGYKNSVLPPAVEKRLAIEAASSLSMYKYVGLKGDVVGIDRFGASAPASVIFSNLGFTVHNIVKRADRLLKS
ncbi:MAG: transketolase [Nitrospiraceae bacterium]|nr:MAG: transketolase [Nitrospiraceae bacterium]